MVEQLESSSKGLNAMPWVTIQMSLFVLLVLTSATAKAVGYASCVDVHKNRASLV